MRFLSAYLWLLAVLTFSGLLLMFLYVPSAAPLGASVPAPPGASAGYIARGVHFWAAQLGLLAALTLLARTIFVKTNRPHTGWAVALVLMTVLLWFTGFLLPWDQLGFWMHRWLNSLSAQDALWAVYWTHTLALSLLMLPVLSVYVRRTRRALAEPT